MRDSIGMVTCHSSLNILGWHLKVPQLLLYPGSVAARHFRGGRNPWNFGLNWSITAHGLFQEYTPALFESFWSKVQTNKLQRACPPGSAFDGTTPTSIPHRSPYHGARRAHRDLTNTSRRRCKVCRAGRRCSNRSCLRYIPTGGGSLSGWIQVGGSPRNLFRHRACLCRRLCEHATRSRQIP